MITDSEDKTQGVEEEVIIQELSMEEGKTNPKYFVVSVEN